MAEEMTPKIDDALDTGSNTKSENLLVQVTSIRLNKDNYLSWSAALEIGITSRGRLSYITGEKPAPSKTDPRWATWALVLAYGDRVYLDPIHSFYVLTPKVTYRWRSYLQTERRLHIQILTWYQSQVASSSG
ncbi:hypothetical protein EJ110_NYTH59925 [Nymphaea thermarum]|nr:hypothetical protein EJ110_NYTH59925 [Nymphaea thermarum]